MLPIPRSLLELTTDSKLIHHAIFNAIGQTAEKIDGLLPPLIKLSVDYLEVDEKERVSEVFGEKEWTDYFGRVPHPPALHRGIEEIWQGPCPIFSGKKVCETHTLVYLPATVNGMPLTLNSLGILAKKYFPQNAAGYLYILDHIVKELGDKPIGNSAWVLMTNEFIPESDRKLFIEQRECVTALGKKTLLRYEVPRTLDAAVCVLTRFTSSRMRLFSNTYTRCQEGVNLDQVVVGGFTPTGLLIDLNNYDGPGIGVAVLSKFF